MVLKVTDWTWSWRT